MARTFEEVIARRGRALFLDTKKSLRIAPEAVKIMANELRHEHHWVKTQLDSYAQLADRYLIYQP